MRLSRAFLIQSAEASQPIQTVVLESTAYASIELGIHTATIQIAEESRPGKESQKTQKSQSSSILSPP